MFSQAILLRLGSPRRSDSANLAACPAFTLAGIGAVNGSTTASARVVIGYVAPVPWRSLEAEKVLVGKSISEDLAKTAADAALQNAAPLSRNTYKVQLAKVAVKRAILKATSGGSA